MMTPQERYEKLAEHLKEENPLLLEAIELYRQLDQVAHKLGTLSRQHTYAAQISWWPLISILGTFSAGKSTFINHYLGVDVQDTGNQAVDDKFTVICYGPSAMPITLPGLALDADPRFPFYKISEKIDAVEPGEGARIDAYLQLKTVKATPLKGKILIDSPGFDADSQRNAVLRITDHIIDLSDLVLIFFDARHPEPGAMRDTLEHLVKTNLNRQDISKILFILNQIDTAANEDNPEDVIAAWQRALSQYGLHGGNFYTIYNEKKAHPIKDPNLAERFKRKKDQDLARILNRISSVSNERAYRIIKALEIYANDLEENLLPKIKQALKQWRRQVIWSEIAIWCLILGLIITTVWYFDLIPPLINTLSTSPLIGIGTAVLTLLVIILIHFKLRHFFAHRLAKTWRSQDETVATALLHNNRWWHPLFSETPRGWSKWAKRRLQHIRTESQRLIQKLNDQFSTPSGPSKEDKATPPTSTETHAQPPDTEKSNT